MDLGDSAAQEALTALADDLHAHHGYRFYPRERFVALPEAVRAGVKRIGGLKRISEGDHHKPSVLKQFCDAYREPAREFAAPAAKLAVFWRRIPLKCTSSPSR